ncbi:branched-chain alpha-ketoacid dehydrogenase [Lipomyces kononenkoae]|uniref:Branched-chain alpha-ketoacid dehydrogenase n=1 Tax=Lipomyces kononenkoae TaxID=34357 RepID=A0ACC3T826_LIPKO
MGSRSTLINDLSIISRCRLFLPRRARNAGSCKNHNLVDKRFNSGVPPSTVSSRHFYQNEKLLEFSARSSRPVSLRQLAFFGMKLTNEKIIQSANFVRQELPTRMAHRIHDMQSLPYSIVQNNHISNVYELYYHSFNTIRRFPVIKTIEDNSRFCDLLRELLAQHTAVIPQLVMGVIECADLVDSKRMDNFMDSMLRSRISRRVLTEQHIALTEEFLKDPNFKPTEQVGQVFFQCSAADIVRQCDTLARSLTQSIHRDIPLPELLFEGDVETKFAYVATHLRYMVGEILRNTFEASSERYKATGDPLSPVLVTINDAPQHVTFRFSDRAGGIPQEIVPYLWSFVKGPRSMIRHHNFKQVPELEAIVEELEASLALAMGQRKRISSLTSLTTRSPTLRLGMGLPMSKIYAEFWGGRIAVKSIEGFGCDVFLHISKLGNESQFVQMNNI